MKTTLVKERIDDLLISSIVAVGVREGGTVRDLDTLIIDRETATQAIQKLVDEECIKARIERDNNARYVLHSILSDDVDSELDHSDIEALFEVRLTTTESPLKPVKGEEV